MRRQILTVLFAGLVGFSTACGSDPEENSTSTDSFDAMASGIFVGAEAVDERSWADGEWPFTVAAGEIVCGQIAQADAVFLVTADDRLWPLNGNARSGYIQVDAEPSLDPIWRDDSESPGMRISVSPAINVGRRICQQSGNGGSGTASTRRASAPAADTRDWYVGGTLHASTKSEWLRATERNQLATSIDWVITIWRSNGDSDALIWSRRGNGEWQLAATRTTDCINEMYDLGGTEDPGVIAIMCYMLINQ